MYRDHMFLEKCIETEAFLAELALGHFHMRFRVSTERRFVAKTHRTLVALMRFGR